MNTVGLRAALLVGVSAGALLIGLGGMTAADAADLKATKAKVLKAPPLPPPPTWFFSAEGGAACSGSNHAARSQFVPGVDLAHVGNACGWTTRLGFGQENTALFGGMADYWGVFVRYTRIQDSAAVNGPINLFYPGFANFYPASISGNSGFDERRTVIDFEAGRDIGIGDGSKLRALAGLRFAHYSSNTNVLGSTITIFGGRESPNFFTKQQFDGIGPRIGFSYRRPVFGMVEVTADGSAAALWGRFKTNVNDSLNFPGGAYTISGQESHNGFVGNLEGSIALAYAPYGPRGWDVSLGVRAEEWFNQIDTNSFSAQSTFGNGTSAGPLSISAQREDRFNWGPFLRVKVPLGN